MTWVAVAVGGSAVIGAGAGIYAGNKASKAARYRSPTEQLLEQLQLQNSQDASKYGKQFLDSAADPISRSTNFWNAVMNGDRQSLMTLYGNDIADLGDQSRTAYRTALELSPRSGISSTYLSSVPFQRAVAERRIFSGAKPMAAGALSSIGTNLASLGMSGLGQGSGGAGSLLNYDFNRNQYADQQGANTAASVYNLIKMIGSGFGNYFQNKNAARTAQQSFWNNPTNYQPYVDASMNYGGGFG